MTWQAIAFLLLPTMYCGGVGCILISHDLPQGSKSRKCNTIGKVILSLIPVAAGFMIVIWLSVR